MKWIPTSADTFFADTMEQHLIVGGSEGFIDYSTANYTNYIGRIAHGGKVIVGKLSLRKAPNDMTFYYVYQNNEATAEQFEILAIDN